MLGQTSQQPHLAALPPVSSVCAESPSLQRCWLCRIPICKFYDLRCAILKIKPQLTPFAVVVCLIQVGSGSYFLFLLRHSVCFSVTVWTSPLSSSFRRSLSSVCR